MSDRLPVLVYRSLAAVGATLAVGGSLWAIGAGHTGFYREQGGDFVTVYAAFLAVMVWMVIPRQPANALVKVTAVSGFLFGLFTVAIPITTSMVNPELLLAESTTPMDLPTAAAWAAAYLAIGWMPPMFTLLTFGLVLFPDGRLPSPRWRIMAAFTVAVIVAGTLGTMAPPPATRLDWVTTRQPPWS